MAKYLVVEQSWEYNDEYFQEGDGYKVASKLYSSKEEAEADCEKRNSSIREEAAKEGEDYYFSDSEGNPVIPFKIVKVEE